MVVSFFGFLLSLKFNWSSDLWEEDGGCRDADWKSCGFVCLPSFNDVDLKAKGWSETGAPGYGYFLRLHWLTAPRRRYSSSTHTKSTVQAQLCKSTSVISRTIERNTEDRIRIQKQVSVNTGYEVWTGILSQCHLSFTRCIQGGWCCSNITSPISSSWESWCKTKGCILLHLVDVACQKPVPEQFRTFIGTVESLTPEPDPP